jgi:hypothetical protein
MRDLRVSFPGPCDEKWEAMTPAGCDRVCGRCDKVIHDLSQLELDEAETLLRGNPGACVRASIGADGTVALKPKSGGGVRRMVIAAAATAGLLAAGAPALARQDRPQGAIAGRVATFGIRIRVTATGPGGETFRATVGNNGRFRIRHIPAGTYRLTFDPACGDSWTVEGVAVGNGETVIPNVENGGSCIVIGLLRIEDGNG